MKKSDVIVPIVVLLIGLALGSVAFPRTTVPTVPPYTVTVSVHHYQILPVEAECTTVSGTTETTYTTLQSGYAGITTAYPYNLPSEYVVYVTTIQYESESITYTTQSAVSSC